MDLRSARRNFFLLFTFFTTFSLLWLVSIEMERGTAEKTPDGFPQAIAYSETQEDEPELKRRFEVLRDDVSWPKHFVVITTKRTEPSVETVKLATRAKEHPDGWHVVIVALHNSNGGPYGELPSTTYLTTEAQHRLPFVTAGVLEREASAPASYARKNLGYLYAIFKGAELIVDADDTTYDIPEGNYPTSNTSQWRQVEDFEPYSREQRKSGSVVAGLGNHYNHFGLAGFTPRGYFRPRSQTTYRPWLPPRNASSSSIAPLQMGLLSKHPDLSGKLVSRLKELHVRWNPLKDPISFTKGTFGVLHSSTAFYYPQAFFTLMIPASSGLSRAVVDVWRGFVAQRLLWAFGYQIGYVPTPMKRNLNDITNEELSELDDSQIQLSALFEPLLQQLVQMKFSVDNTTEVWSVFSSLYQTLHLHGLVDSADSKLAKAWATDIKLLLKAQKRTNASSPSDFDFKSYIESAREERPIITFSHKTNSDKKFFYGTQTDVTTLPPRLSEALPDDVDLVALNYASNADNMIFLKDTWSVGRNVLLQELYIAERYQGYQYDFVLMLDDDIKLRCREFDSDRKYTGVEYPSSEDLENVDAMRRCYKRFQEYTYLYQSAVLFPCMADYQTHAFAQGTPDMDACYNMFHREAIDQVLPYYTDLDIQTWWASQRYLIDVVNTFYHRHVHRCGPVYLHNTQSRPYPRGMHGFERIEEQVFAKMPPQALAYEGAFAEKNRSYADLCSCDSVCRASFCAPGSD